MVFKNLPRRLTATAEELDDERLVSRYAGLDITPLGDVPLRQPVRVGGEVKGQRLRMMGGARSVELTVSDGTGTALAVYTGRQQIPGLELGRSVLLEGVGRRERNRVVFVNPAYTLLA